MLARGFPEPFVHFAAFELGHAVAARADEMVVVPLAAQAVAGLARAVCELVDDAVLAEDRERPVDGGEADRIAALAKARVDLLRGRIMRFRRERLEDEQALTRCAEAGLRRRFPKCFARRSSTIPYCRHETENHSHTWSRSPANRMWAVREGRA